MIYLDNAATSFPKPPGVAEAAALHIKTCGVSSGRGSYDASVEASRTVFECREKIGGLLGIKDSSRIAFTLNATAAINTLLFGFLKKSARVITTNIEHNSMMRPLNVLQNTFGITVEKAGYYDKTGIDIDDFRKKIRMGADLAAVNHASNVTGAVTELREIGIICREKGVPLLVDAAQTAGYLPVDAEDMNISMLAFSGHKGLMGPTGCGGLYVSGDIEVKPLFYGGTGSNSEKEVQPDFWPDRMESGTLPMTAIAGLNSSLDFISVTGSGKIRARISLITSYLISKLSSIKGIIIYGPGADCVRTSAVSFNIKGKLPSDIALAMNRAGICVRTGLCCAPGTHKAAGTFPNGTVRISPGYFSTEADIDQAVSVLKKI